VNTVWKPESRKALNHKIVIVNDYDVYRLQWEFLDERGNLEHGTHLGENETLQSILGIILDVESGKPLAEEDLEHFVATATLARLHTGRDSVGFHFKTKVKAEKALTLVIAAIKEARQTRGAGKAPSKKAWPAWALKAKEAGWTPPKGWTP